VEGSEASAGRSDRGQQAEHIEVRPPVHGTRTDSHGDPSGMANLSAEEPDALMRARPGLWERWGATPSATRPEARNYGAGRGWVPRCLRSPRRLCEPGTLCGVPIPAIRAR